MAAQAHPVFEGPPDPDVKIWRYMALSKFVWMIQKRALYFCRADLLGDPFEGHYTRITSLSEDAFVASQMTDEVFRTIPESTWRENFRKILAEVPDQKLSMFVNCWHMNEK